MITRFMVQARQFNQWHFESLRGETEFRTIEEANAAIARVYPDLQVEGNLRVVEVVLVPLSGVIVSGAEYGTRLDFRTTASAPEAPREHA